MRKQETDICFCDTNLQNRHITLAYSLVVHVSKGHAAKLLKLFLRVKQNTIKIRTTQITAGTPWFNPLLHLTWQTLVKSSFTYHS